jgi:hypothetical protein
MLEETGDLRRSLLSVRMYVHLAGLPGSVEGGAI